MPCTVFCRNTDVAFVSLVLMGAAFFIFLVPGRFCRGYALTLGDHAAGAVHGIELRLHNHFMCDGGTYEKDGGVVWGPAGGDNGIWVQSY